VTYRFLSPAQQELAEAMVYYERASPGLGLEFLDELERTISRILLHPLAWTRVSELHRRCRTRRSPYGVIYAIEGDTVLITAVMELLRHPDTWKRRLGCRFLEARAVHLLLE
jgi:plasmid stabilization system protein ParE